RFSSMEKNQIYLLRKRYKSTKVTASGLTVAVCCGGFPWRFDTGTAAVCPFSWSKPTVTLPILKLGGGLVGGGGLLMAVC
nr:hypothetical protein [Tanacetum cinerariifolium]